MQTLQPPMSTPSTEEAAGLPYFAGLDGLRALAVLAVLIYHADLPLPGGFLGVEVFFVLSGFLITALLAAEWNLHNRIDLPAFWLRRARRLLPALCFMLPGTALIAGLSLQGEPAGLGADMLAAVGYVMNWHLILGGQSYFDPLVRPSLLQHLWSLAVEEQFYLVWPLLFLLGMRLLRAKGLLVLVLAAAVASLALMAGLYRPGADPSRIYYGTDTRAGGLLIGAALALLWPATRTSGPSRPWTPLLLDGAGLLALGGLIAAFLWLPEWHPLLYRGGFALVDLLTAILIVAVTHPTARLMPRLLGSQPLRWIGLRSYGLYLWHWPIFTVTRPYIDLPLGGLPLLGLRLAIVFVLVEISYRFIELPVRRGTLERLWHRWRAKSTLAGLGGPRSSSSVTGRLWPLLPLLLLLAVGTQSFRRSQPDVVARAPERTGASRLVAVTPAPTTPAAPALPATTSADRDSTESFPPAATPALAAAEPLDPALAEQLQLLLDETVADGTIPGAVLSVSIPGYQPWNGSSGVASRSDGGAMAPETLIHISSITKMFTAVVVLQLAEEGRIELDAPIGSYLPEIVPLANRTTVRHLLMHTSGIFDYLEDSRFFIEAYQNPERTYTPGELVGMVGDFGAAFEPGTEGAWKYSSTNYVILGMLVEQVTGRTMAEEVVERIFEPLKLQHTFFAPYQAPQGTIAQGYIDDSDRASVSMTFVFATGNIISTAGDLRRFAEGLFGGQLLSVEALELMRRVVETGGAYGMPELQYGLGVMQAQLNVARGPNGEERPPELSTVLGHIGGIAGSRAAVWHVKGSRITIALGLNQANVDPNLLARDTLDVILAWQGK